MANVMATAPSKGGARQASRQIAALALPAVAQNMVDWLRPVLFNVIVSRNIKASGLDEARAALEMDSAALAILTLNIVCFATAYGFNGSVDAYAPIAFGEKKVLELHLVLHRQLVFLAVLTALSCAVLWQAEAIFLRLDQQPELSQRAAEILRMLVLAVPGDYVYDCSARWMKAQQLHREVSCCTFLGLVVNLACNLALYDPARPIVAPVLSLIAQNSVLPVLLLLAYVRKERLWRAPWSAVCSDWAPQCATGLKSTVWTCAEMWAWEVQVFEASALGAGAAASYVLTSTTYSLLIMIPAAFACSALSALVGEALGQRNVPQALLLVRVALLQSLCVVALYAAPMVVGRRWYAEFIGGSVPQVEADVVQVLPVIMVMHVPDIIFNVFKTWLTLRKHQGFGAVMTLMSYYCFGLPLGCWLSFSGRLGVVGLWLGLGAAVFLGAALCAGRTWIDVRSC